MKSPDLTLLLGPQTRLGRALNDIIRERRVELHAQGLVGYPSRVGDKAFRDFQSGNSRDDVLASLGIGHGTPVLLAATKGLGAPANSFRRRELLPDAEACLALWADLMDGIELHVILTIDPLPTFFADMNHASANAAVAATPWDALYEVIWADLVSAVVDMLPDAQVTVLTERGAFVSAETVLPLVFGDAAAAVTAGQLRSAVFPIVGDAALPQGRAKLSALFETTSRRPGDAWLKSELAMDGVTADLLQDRFVEDLKVIAGISGVQLI